MTQVTCIPKLQPSNAILEDNDEKQYYWKVILTYWKLPPYFHHFPGLNPMSLERNNFDRLKTDDFLVALKTDGVRHLLLMTTKPNSTEPISLMIDRTLRMSEIEVWASEEYFYNGCLLDGELVWNNNEELQFVVFDVILFKGVDCINYNYRDRLRIIHTNILSMDANMDDDTIEKIIAEEDKFCARNNMNNLQLYPKICVSKQQLDDIWKSRNLCSHRNDGIIFTWNDAPVHTGTSTDVFKWKPSHSIDIRCICYDDVWSFWGNDNSSDDEINITKNIGLFETSIDTDSKFLQTLKRKGQFVVECLIIISGNKVVLEPERERTDKKTANTMKTIEATIRNAKEQVSIDELFNLMTCNSTIIKETESEEKNVDATQDEDKKTEDEEINEKLSSSNAEDLTTPCTDNDKNKTDDTQTTEKQPNVAPIDRKTRTASKIIDQKKDDEKNDTKTTKINNGQEKRKRNTKN